MVNHRPFQGQTPLAVFPMITRLKALAFLVFGSQISLSLLSDPRSCALVTLAAMVRSEECEKTCVGCGTLRPAGYSGWRGPNGDYCSRDKCRKKVEELNGGSAKDKRIAQLEACVKQQSEQISAQKELIDLLKLQLRQASGQTAGSGGGHLIAQAGGGASEVREVAVGEKRPAPEAAPAARPAACDTLRHGAVDRAPLQRLDRVNLPVQQPRPAKRPNTAASGRPQAAQLPRGWSTRVAMSTGRSVWEQAFHRVRLEHEPDASRVCATILKQLLHLREPNPVRRLARRSSSCRSCMSIAWGGRFEHVVTQTARSTRLGGERGASCSLCRYCCRREIIASVKAYYAIVRCVYAAAAAAAAAGFDADHVKRFRTKRFRRIGGG